MALELYIRRPMTVRAWPHAGDRVRLAGRSVESQSHFGNALFAVPGCGEDSLRRVCVTERIDSQGNCDAGSQPEFSLISPSSLRIMPPKGL